MYTPPSFREDDPDEIRPIMREARLASLVPMTNEGLLAMPSPLVLDETEGRYGTQ